MTKIDRLTIQTAATEEAARSQLDAVDEEQRAFARACADSIERGELPAGIREREFIARILRWHADRPKPAPKKKRGNPNFAKKIHDPDYVALLVGFAIGFGKDASDAIADIACDLDVDRSTVDKLFRDRREAVALWFANSNLAHRVGAIRGE